MTLSLNSNGVQHRALGIRLEAEALLDDVLHTDNVLLLTETDAAELVRMIRAARRFLNLNPEGTDDDPQDLGHDGRHGALPHGERDRQAAPAQAAAPAGGDAQPGAGLYLLHGDGRLEQLGERRGR